MVAYAGSHSSAEISAHGTQEFEQFVFHHPFQEAELLAKKTSAYWSVARPYAFWFYLNGLPQKIVFVWSVVWSFVLFVLGLSGAWLMWESKRPLDRWLLLLALLMPLSVIPIIVETRYRLPVYPFLALFGGYFAARWHRLRQEDPQDHSLSKVALVVAALVVADAAFDALRNARLIFGRLGL
jgi:hypothetical protein